MILPINYENMQYISGKHIFKIIIDNNKLSLNSLTNIPTCNVMSITNINVGINTDIPLNTFHVKGNSYFRNYIGIGTTIPRTGLDIFNKNMIISNNIGIGTTNPLHSCHIQGNSYFNGNIGIGTTLPLKPVHIQTESYFKGNISIGSTISSAPLYVNGDIQSPILVGQVSFFAINNAPIGWILCDGSSISRNKYAILFSEIGTTFGVGDNSTTFGIPDLRGQFIRGWDNGRGIDVNRSFGSIQTDAMLNHTHTGTASGTTDSIANHTHTYTYRTNGVSGFGGSGTKWAFIASSSTGSSGNHTHTLSANYISGNPSNNGNIETRPRNVAMAAYIKY